MPSPAATKPPHHPRQKTILLSSLYTAPNSSRIEAEVNDDIEKVVRVNRERLIACMSCGICKKLLVNATTISECLHTFCRECIIQKLDEEELDCCPTCNVELGPAPLEKLRSDYNMQAVSDKIFNSPGGNIPIPDEQTGSSPMIKRVYTRKPSTSREVLRVAKGTSQSRSLGTESGAQTSTLPEAKEHKENQNTLNAEASSPIQKKSVDTQNTTETSNSSVTAEDVSRNENQNTSNAETSRRAQNAITKNVTSYLDWRKNFKPFDVIEEVKTMNHPNKSTVKDSKQPATPEPGKYKRKRTVSFRDSATSAQELIDAEVGRPEKGTSPIWFFLVASSDMNGNVPLPQLPTSFLRIKNPTLPTSFLQKYLAHKLALGSEAEVYITCHGQPVNPATPLHAILDMWLQGSPSNKVKASVGKSAEKFVAMVNYSSVAPFRGGTVSNPVSL